MEKFPITVSDVEPTTSVIYIHPFENKVQINRQTIAEYLINNKQLFQKKLYGFFFSETRLIDDKFISYFPHGLTPSLKRKYPNGLRPPANATSTKKKKKPKYKKNVMRNTISIYVEYEMQDCHRKNNKKSYHPCIKLWTNGTIHLSGSKYCNIDRNMVAGTIKELLTDIVKQNYKLTDTNKLMFKDTFKYKIAMVNYKFRICSSADYEYDIDNIKNVLNKNLKHLKLLQNSTECDIKVLFSAGQKILHFEPPEERVYLKFWLSGKVNVKTLSGNLKHVHLARDFLIYLIKHHNILVSVI